LVAPDSGLFGVVTFDARTGVLYCLGNTLEATAYGTGQNNEYAFLATGNAPIVIRNNTSRVVHSSGNPIWGNVTSPPVGHDGTNYLLSNWNDPTGAY